MSNKAQGYVAALTAISGIVLALVQVDMWDGKWDFFDGHNYFSESSLRLFSNYSSEVKGTIFLSTVGAATGAGLGARQLLR